MCASQVLAMDLPELVVPDLATYRACAIELATHPEILSGLRARLSANRSTSILFNSKRFTRQLEDVYAEMSRRHRAGVPHTTPIAS
jgi:predicted O-linked N-acetylglucosamine transferase (SPINDLY family)